MSLDLNIAYWSVLPPADSGATKFGKTLLLNSANGMKVTGVLQKHTRLSGEFWAVLRADSPGTLAVLQSKLQQRGYAVVKKARGDVPPVLLQALETCTSVAIGPSADDVHSFASSGARDRGEAPASDEDAAARLTLRSLSQALDDAAAQTALASRRASTLELRLAVAQGENGRLEEKIRAAEKAEREAKEATEKAERAAKEAAEKAEREVKEAAEKILALVERAARAEAERAAADERARAAAAAKCCVIV